MSGKLVTVFGGSGFIGRYAVRALCKAGWRVRVAVRNPMNAGDMRLSGEVGQVQIIQANVRNRPSIIRALDGADAVVNLVGILYEKGRQSFDGTHALGAANIAEYAAAEGIKTFVQMSAIGANVDSKAKYARTKGEAEREVLSRIPTATMLRPSIVFGPEDGFFNMFGQMSQMSPVLPLIGGGKTKFQPVHVADVADAIAAAVESEDARGKTYELGGPNTYTFKELMQFIVKTVDRKRLLAPLPYLIAQPLGSLTDFAFRLWPFAGPPLTGDQVEMLKTDNIVHTESDVGTIEDLGVKPLETIEAIVPQYLWRYRSAGQFHIHEEDEVSRVDV